MRLPLRLETLLEQGIIEEVVRPLMSGKEAQVYLVLAGGEERVAKVYKEALVRSFKHRSAYTEGRKVRNSRDQRAMSSHSRHGREQDEAAWRSTEVEMIHRLRAVGVRVPRPHDFVEGVLVMELVKDAAGDPAPRLGDVELDRATAVAAFETLLREVVKMLCAGVVHGDLSDFNVLLGEEGPVLIDFPQALDASTNLNTRTILLRDVANLNRFLSRFVPEEPKRYGEEMWALYERGELRPDTKLTGRHQSVRGKTDVGALQRELDEVRKDEERRRQSRGLPPLSAAPSDRGGPAPEHRRPDAGRPARTGRAHEASADRRPQRVARPLLPAQTREAARPFTPERAPIQAAAQNRPPHPVRDPGRPLTSERTPIHIVAPNRLPHPVPVRTLRPPAAPPSSSPFPARPFAGAPVRPDASEVGGAGDGRRKRRRRRKPAAGLWTPSAPAIVAAAPATRERWSTAPQPERAERAERAERPQAFPASRRRRRRTRGPHGPSGPRGPSSQG